MSSRLSDEPLPTCGEEDGVALRLLYMICGKWIAQAIGVAAELRIADWLSDGPRSIAELAASTASDPKALRRLLRSLASVDVFELDANDCCGLTPLAEKLQTNKAGSLRDFAVMQGGKLTWGPYGRLADTVRTGIPAFRLFHEKSVFEFLGGHSEANEVFDRAMQGITALLAPPLVATYDFSEIGTLADIGGGCGQMLSIVLQDNPAMKGILFDLQHAITKAGGFLATSGVADRVEQIAGNFFEAIPQKADAYLLRLVLHDWEDKEALVILRNVRAVIPENGKLLVVESIVTKGNDPGFAKLLDVEMLVVTGGRERNEKEYEALLALAGFRLTRVVGRDLWQQILEAVPC